MKYLYLLACLLPLLAFGRDNPFVSTTLADSNTTNIITKLAGFSQTSVNLPSDARELEAVVVVYKSVDGSLKEKRVDIRASFDWRDTIYISRQAMPKNGEVVDVSVTAQGNSTEARAITNLTEGPPLQALATPSQKTPLASADIVAGKINAYANKIVINTPDLLLKSYDKGSRIVMDFEKKSKFLTHSREFGNKTPLRRATVGSHGKFYRVVLELDKKYKYSIRQNSSSYTIWLGK